LLLPHYIIILEKLSDRSQGATVADDQLEQEIVDETFGDANEIDPDVDLDEAVETIEEEALAPEPEQPSPALDPTQAYLREIGFVPLLTPEEELHYARLSIKGDEKAKHRMIEGNLRLVVKIARGYLNRGMDFLDLIEEGNLGLMHALEKFDPERGFRFSTYATWWIKQTIERAIMNQTRTIRLPIHVIKEMNIYLRAGKELTKKLGNNASPEKIADSIDKPAEEVRLMLNLRETTVSLDSTISYDMDKTLVDIIPDENIINPEDILEDEFLVGKLELWLGDLSEKHREVLMRRFGIGNYDEKQTFEEIGEALGLSRERVRQVQAEALRELRDIVIKAGVSAEDI
jgi:RNA polymerase nonessential primary-like sigma factor